MSGIVRPRSPFLVNEEDSEVTFVVPTVVRSATPPALTLKRPTTPVPLDSLPPPAAATGKRADSSAPNTPRASGTADAGAWKWARSSSDLRGPPTSFPRTLLFWLSCAAISMGAGFVLSLLGGGGTSLGPSLPAPAPWHLHPLVDAELPRLTAALAAEFSVRQPSSGQRQVIVAFTDWGANSADTGHATAQQQQLARSFSRTLASHSLPCLLGLSWADSDTTELLTRGGAARVLGETLPGASVSPGGCAPFFAGERVQSRASARMGRWWHIAQLLEWGFEVLSLDLDVALLRDPLPYLQALTQAHPHLDLLTSSDGANGQYNFPPEFDGSEPSLYTGEKGPARAWIYSIIPRSYFGAQPLQPGPSRWERAFGHLVRLSAEERYVSKPEFRERDGWGMTSLLKKLEGGSFEIGLETPLVCQSIDYNVGMQFWRPTDGARKLIREQLLRAMEEALLKSLPPGATRQDQPVFNAVVRQGARLCDNGPAKSAQEDARLSSLCAKDRMLNTVGNGVACLGVLSLAQFGNGFVFAVARSHEQLGVVPFAMHSTYTRDKLMRLREEGALADDDDYYNLPDVRFLSYQVNFDPSLVPQPNLTHASPVEYNYLQHYSLMQVQLRHFRAALGLARLLNRTLVLFHVACLCECFYFPGKRCVVDGHRVRVPHVCPTDHWLRLDRLKMLGVPYREPGFLENPRLGPGRVSETQRSATLTVHVPLLDSREQLIELPVMSKEPRATLPLGELGAVALQPGLRAEKVATLLAPWADARVLHFGDAAAVWGGYGSERERRRFADETQILLGAWCCLAEHPDTGLSAGERLWWKMPYSYDAPLPTFVKSNEDVGQCGD